MGHNDRRDTPRRAKSIRLRFVVDGEEHRAVTTTVSATGAFVKSSYVPRAGTTATFREVYNHGGAQLQLRGEVEWGIDEASLDRPDTGFGLRFIEVFTQDDPGTLEEFLRYLDPDRDVPFDVQFEERPSGVFAVYRFDDHDDRAETRRTGRPRSLHGDASTAEEDAELEELQVVDLARELDRLEREHARTNGAEPRTVAPVSVPLAAPATPIAAQAPARAAAVEATAGDTEALRAPRDRTRRRTVTGIFTALFSRKRDVADDDVDAAHGHAATPPIGAVRPPVHDARLPRVAVSWPGGRVDAGVRELGDGIAVVRAEGEMARSGTDVDVAPLDDDPQVQGLRLRARVVARKPGATAGVDEYTLAIEVPETREQTLRFGAWMRRVNGPSSGR